MQYASVTVFNVYLLHLGCFLTIPFTRTRNSNLRNPISQEHERVNPSFTERGTAGRPGESSALFCCFSDTIVLPSVGISQGHHCGPEYRTEASRKLRDTPGLTAPLPPRNSGSFRDPFHKIQQLQGTKQNIKHRKNSSSSRS